MVRHSTFSRSAVAAVAAVGVVAALSGCAGAGDGRTEISFLTWNDEQQVTMANALISAFEAEHPDIKVSLETQPSGAEGDNLVKTKLSTGEMNDVFFYNSGSLFQALNPDQFLAPLGDEAWTAELTDDMVKVVSTDKGLYGSPLGTSQVGGVMYNKKVYAQLGLSVPTTWDDFVANNEKIKAAGDVAPVIQTYGDTWTSQILFLGAFGNVLQQDPEWADEYTANKRKFADEPAVEGFEIIQQLADGGYFNKNFASAMYDEGVRMLASGEGAHWPILTQVIAAVMQNYPDDADDIGVFAIPAKDASDTTLTVWLPNAVYIPKTTEGDKLAAAKEFVAFINSAKGCEIQGTSKTPSGPFATKACTLPSDVPAALRDMQAYFDSGDTAPALEYLSPIKGPSLEQITVEVGSGIRSAKDGAALYDEDVKKQAQQLGVPGW